MHTPVSADSDASSQRTLAEEQEEEERHPLRIKHGYPEEDLRPDKKANNLGRYSVQLGESFDNGRFVVVRKLRMGMNPNVWLARDMIENRLVSLKILNAILNLSIVPKPGSSEADEIRMLVKIAEADPSHPGYKHFPALLHKFAIESGHGDHICLVTEVLCNGSKYFQGLPLEVGNPAWVGLDVYLPLGVVKELTRQMLRAVDYLHQKCGIVHCDIKPAHVLFRSKSIDRIASKQLLTNPSIIAHGKTPSKLTALNSQPIPLPVQRGGKRKSRHEETVDWEVVLVDMGHSNWTAYHYYEGIQLLCYRAPEVILRYPWTTEPNIWNIGCVVRIPSHHSSQPMTYFARR
ncbi:kinase-like domain-containing protein [Pterulicium gracile]|uniref:non-specific serine/threonine protein kinase n=1 Tax=Pterulicium gracile TaxID=1884261 RepID=A0A5C3Q0P9_9AGAR|nr:kinase-like domain-containing protein [Pterula gracilis]